MIRSIIPWQGRMCLGLQDHRIGRRYSRRLWSLAPGHKRRHSVRRVPRAEFKPDLHSRPPAGVRVRSLPLVAPSRPILACHSASRRRGSRAEQEAHEGAEEEARSAQTSSRFAPASPPARGVLRRCRSQRGPYRPCLGGDRSSMPQHLLSHLPHKLPYAPR